MSKQLFRQQAIDYRKQRVLGDVVLLPQLSHTHILSALLLWVFAVFVWLLFSHYARKETVVGWFEPPEGIIRAYAETTGIVEKVLLSKGEHIAENISCFGP